MICEGCGLTMAPGSAHISLEGCVAALREALARSRACLGCGETVTHPLHPRCMATAAASHGAKIGTQIAMDAATRKALEVVSGFFGGGATRDDDRPRREGGGKRYKP